MDARFLNPIPIDPPEIDQAKRVLAWLDQYVVQSLPETDRHKYQQARHITGLRATTTRAKLFSGGPQVRVPRMEVRGGGDDAYAHVRLEEIVKKVLIPLIQQDQLALPVSHELYQRLRGNFANLCVLVEQAEGARQRSKKRSNDEDTEL